MPHTAMKKDLLYLKKISEILNEEGYKNLNIYEFTKDHKY